MQSFADYLAMGGYAAYVWPAFGFTLVVLLGLLGQSWWAARRREAEFARLRRSARAPAPRAAAAPRRAVRAGGEPAPTAAAARTAAGARTARE